MNLRRFLPGAGLLAAAVLLAGCAEPMRIPPGTSAAEVLKRLGPPTGRYPLTGGGERLQYSRAPMGYQVVDIDVGADGKVASVTQVLTEARFAHDIQIDRWRRNDVLAFYGPPEDVTRVASFDGEVWQWRYRQINEPRLLYIYIDPTGVVRRYHVSDDLRFNSNAERS